VALADHEAEPERLRQYRRAWAPASALGGGKAPSRADDAAPVAPDLR
jgi:hypothetical protein